MASRKWEICKAKKTNSFAHDEHVGLKIDLGK